MVSGKDLVLWIQGYDFGILLPTLARMPLFFGEWLARIRGFLLGLFDYEWRSLALGQRYIRARTWHAMNILYPQKGRIKRFLLTLERFSHNSREEWQACLFSHKVMLRIFQRSKIEEVHELLEHQNKGRGMVLVSCHLDSFCLGMVLMGMAGLRVNVINTAMIEDPRIHPKVRDFFNRKYRTMEHLMNGRMPYYQTEKPFFYKALQKGEIVTLMGDIPGSKSNVIISFCGQKFRMPLGAWHMANETNSLLGAYVCIREGVGQYRIKFLKPFEPNADSPLHSMEPIYSFLEKWIRKYPQRWVASDLLPVYGYDI